MKLSDLVAYYNALQRFSVADIARDTNMHLDEIMHEVQCKNFEIGSAHLDLKTDLSHINTAFDQFGQTFAQLKTDIKQTIETVEKPYFAESYRMYEQEMVHESVDWILNRRMPMSEESQKILQGRINSYSEWRHPGMIIRPGLEDFINSMVSFDPLYIVDREHDLLVPAMSRFPEDYQRRLRPYYFQEYTDGPVLARIPNDQFGFVLAFNFFNFKPFEVIKQYFSEIFQKLKPGGVLAITINDCDRAHCVALVEANFTCYTPGRMVKDLACSIGFDPIFSWHDNGNLSWLELKKPGTLQSLRGGQTLAKIIHK